MMLDYRKLVHHKYFYFLLILSFTFFGLCCQKSVPGEDSEQEPPKEEEPTASLPWIDDYIKVSQNGQFIRGGKEYYGIGINYFDAFYRFFVNNTDSYKNGFEVLSKNNIPFIRFTLLGYWPNDMKKYLDNKEEFYNKLDRFLTDAEKYKIGLIPSFFWNYATIPDVVGESTNQWENPNSKSIALMKQCTDEIVQRYKDKNIIWAWEFSNEINIYVDPIGRTDENHKWMYVRQVNVPQGTPAERTFADSVSTDGLRLALKEFSTVIRKHDSNRAIFTGNGMSHPGAYQRYTHKTWSYGSDSPAQYTLAVGLHNPEYIGTITIHPYPPHEKSDYFKNKNNTFDDILRETMRSSKELQRPLFIGEWGADTSLGTNEAKKFNEYLASIIANKVQLSALWVFDYSYQNGSWNITENNIRSYQLKAIGDANLKFHKNN